MKSIFYLKTSEVEDGIFMIRAKDFNDAKRIYRHTFGLKKMPMGSIISKDRNCGFFGKSSENIAYILGEE